MAELDKLPQQARGTWEGFLALTRWAVLLIALVLILMAIFLA
ncbi:aa3-type cytochrome c oxidase subunit IV [Thermaurantiacus sp.]